MSRRLPTSARSATPAPRAQSLVGAPDGAPLRAIPVLLIVAVLLVFGRSATFEFTHWDDYGNVGMNPNLSPPTLAHLEDIWAEPYANMYIPVTYTVWWLLAHVGYVTVPDDAGSHLNASVFHCANLLVHALAACVVFALAKRLIGKPWPACAAALLFALHPVQVDTVAWITGMRDLLAGLCGLLALWQYVCFVQASPLEPKRAWLHYAVALAVFILGLLSKPTVAMLPIAAGALDYWVLRRSFTKVMLSLLPWLLLAAPALLLARLVQSSQGLPITPIWSRPLIAGDALAFYLGKIFWPAHLAPDYGRRPIEVLRHGWVYVAWIIPVALCAAAWMARRRWPWAPATVAVFLATLIPVLGLSPFMFQYFSTVTDHYLYLAMLGPALALGWGVAMLEKRVAARILVAGASVLVIALGLRSAWQTGIWRDNSTLWRHTLEVNPHSFSAYTNLGLDAEKAGDLSEARTMLQAACHENPRYPDAIYDLIIFDMQASNWGEAMELGAQLIEATGDTSYANQVRYLGIYAALGTQAIKQGDERNAKLFFSEVNRLDPRGLIGAKTQAEKPNP